MRTKANLAAVKRAKAAALSSVTVVTELLWLSYLCFCLFHIKVKVKCSRYRPGCDPEGG